MKGSPLDMFNSLPLPIRLFFVLFFLFLILVPCGFVAAFAGFPGVIQSIIAFWFAAMLLLAVFWLAYSFLKGGGSMRKMLMDSWADTKKFMEVDERLSLVPGEKIVFPITECYIKSSTGLSYREYPRDVIVTNMRIVPGFRINLLFFEQKETFGQMSFWHPKTGQIPLASAGDILGANTKIKSITLGSDKDGDYIDIRADYAVPNWMRIYHPKAKEIYELFSK